MEKNNFSQEPNQNPNGFKRKASLISTEFEASFWLLHFPILTYINYYLIFAS